MKLNMSNAFISGPNDRAVENYDEGRHHIAKAASGMLTFASMRPKCRLVSKCCSPDCWPVKESVLLPQQPDPLGACMCPPMCGGVPFHRELCIKLANLQTDAPITVKM